MAHADDSNTAGKLPGEHPAGADQLLPLVYDELRGLADGFFRRERNNHTLEPTALVNEACVRLLKKSNVNWSDRNHFLQVAATAMRLLLTDYARQHRAQKRGGDHARITLHSGLAAQPAEDIDLVRLEDALTKLQALNARQAQVVELRFLIGLSVEDTARLLQVSPRTIELDTRLARAWLRREIEGGRTSDDTA